METCDTFCKTSMHPLITIYADHRNDVKAISRSSQGQYLLNSSDKCIDGPFQIYVK